MNRPHSWQLAQALPGIDELAPKWAAHWEADQTYRFDPDDKNIYSIDTPPPTVSGELHMGSVFCYTHADVIARFQRMRGKNVFYPMGWDDNGLATERRVQNFYNVQPGTMARNEFIELCHQLTKVDEKAFEETFRELGLSVDWSRLYTTIGESSRSVSQREFLAALERGDAYRSDAPTLWDTTFRTAVAQAELEDRERPGAYHSLHFGGIEVKTTRPELLPACVALVAHPDDARYQHLFGQFLHTPLFGQEVPVMPHRLADPEKGTGIAMVCTFGDTTDVIWWRELDLPTRPVLGFDGRMLPDVPHLGGLTINQARAKIVEMLNLTPEPITHQVKFYERGDRPLEIIVSGQWYLRNGGRDAALREELLERGRELQWHPPHMRVRYEHWVNGLAGDWLISRQRYFGVPIPLWYPLSETGEPLYDKPITPLTLPVDPSTDTPSGYAESQRNQPGGFIGEPDVLDTWATSSLTPLLAGFDGQMDLRPQGPEIIRTWLFSTVLREHTAKNRLPWRHTMINGWILDPDRKKMSKSIGNVKTPKKLFEEYGSDAVRYWASSARPGVDTAFDTGQMRIGRRLAMKILNATKFVLSFPPGAAITSDLDRSLIATLNFTIGEATQALEDYDFGKALEVSERAFWSFCDDYLELVKARAYAGDESARATLHAGLSVLLRLLAPVLPFATEEAWSWSHSGSIHKAPWPTPMQTDGDPAVLAATAEAITAVRRLKSQAKLSMKTPLEEFTVDSPLVALEDLRAAGNITHVLTP